MHSGGNLLNITGCRQKLNSDSSQNWVCRAQGDVHRIEAYFMGTAYAPHRHDTYTIGITLQGVQSFDYMGSTKHALPGEMVILHPDELHDGRAGTDEGFRYRTIYIEPSLIQKILDGKRLPFIEGGISSDKRLYAALFPLLEEYDQPLDAFEYEDALYTLVRALDDITGAAKPINLSNYTAAEMARQYIHESLEEGICLENLEQVTGHDRWELSRDFKVLFGTSPYRYLIMRRLDKARAMLMVGDGLADIAVACGFSDQSHFNRHFKKAFGMTPLKWTRAFACQALN